MAVQIRAIWGMKVHAVVLGMMDEDQIEENLGFVSELISA